MYFGFLHIADGVYVLCYVYYIYKYIYDDSGYCATLYIRVQIALDLKRHTDTGCVWVCTTHQALGMTGLYLYVRPWAWALSGVADMWEKVLWMIELRNSGRTLFFRCIWTLPLIHVLIFLPIHGTLSSAYAICGNNGRVACFDQAYTYKYTRIRTLRTHNDFMHEHRQVYHVCVFCCFFL